VSPPKMNSIPKLCAPPNASACLQPPTALSIISPLNIVISLLLFFTAFFHLLHSSIFIFHYALDSTHKHNSISRLHAPRNTSIKNSCQPRTSHISIVSILHILHRMIATFMYFLIQTCQIIIIIILCDQKASETSKNYWKKSLWDQIPNQRNTIFDAKRLIWLIGSKFSDELVQNAMKQCP
jgi:hypothetical protein